MAKETKEGLMHCEWEEELIEDKIRERNVFSSVVGTAC